MPIRNLTVVAIGVALLVASTAPAQENSIAAQRTVLIIDESDPAVGVPTTLSATLRATLAGAAPHVRIHGETLDFSRLAGSERDATLRAHLKEKYGGIQFSAI